MESQTRKKLIEWLLQGDPAIQYQTQRDLLQNDDKRIQARIAKEGWGARFLAQRGALTPQHWGQRFYQPKWISTHYTLLDLKHLQIKPHIPEIQETLNVVLTENKAKDGGISLGGDGQHSDACVNGMILNYACYFGVEPAHIQSITDCLLDSQLGDGGFNCNYNSKGAMHSSMHSTISILEGFAEFEQQGYRYRLPEISKQSAQAREFLLQHRLYKSDHSGQVIKHGFTMLSFPSRWFYDVLRALVYFAENRIAFDPRMDDALDLLQEKRRKDGRWPLQSKHAGQVHFDMESAGKPSRWNTLRALRVFDIYLPGYIN